MKINGTRFVVRFEYDQLVYDFQKVSKKPINTAVEALVFINKWRAETTGYVKVEIIDYCNDGAVLSDDDIIMLVQKEESDKRGIDNE